MPSVVTCPACNRKLNLPDQLLGQQVRCPTCNGTFRGEASVPPPLPAPMLQTSPVDLLPPLPEPPRPAPPEPPRAAPPRLPEPPRTLEPEPIPIAQSCPSCGETLRSATPHCPYCGERLGGMGNTGQVPWEGERAFRRDWEPHRGTLILTLGVMSIALLPICSLPSVPLGICAWILGQSDLRKMKRNEMDPLGEGSTQAGWICGIIGTVLSVGMFGCCGFYMLAIAATGP